MSGRLFTGRIAPTKEPLSFMLVNKAAHASSRLQKLFTKDSLNLQTYLLGGALFQLCASILLPTRWAVVPSVVILLSCLVSSSLQSSARAATNQALLSNVVLGRVTAQLPSETGQLGPDPANKSVVVFNLGVQWNHPLGGKCPGAAEIVGHFMAMNADLHRRRDEFGLLGVSNWKGGESEEAAGSTFLATYYFKDEASIHKFAHEEIHHKGWDFYNAAKPQHIGLFHETFVVPARAYETMYVNCSPTLMGRGMAKCETEDGTAQWVNTLVSADTPALKTQYSRMGRDFNGNVKEDDAAF